MNTDWLRKYDSVLPWLTRRQRLVVLYAVALTALVLVYTVLYNYGMRTLEGHDHSLFRSFQTVIETMTTTGYGADSPWETPLMNVFVVFMQVTGIGIGLATLRILVIPLFERAPLDLSDRLTAKDDHVVIAEYRRDSKVLLDELERLGVDYVLIESDEDDAKRLSDDGYQAVHGDPVRDRALEKAMIEDASVLVTDAGDDNVDVTLTALRHNDALEVVALTDAPAQEAILREVGADRVFSPHALIGRRLGQKTNVWVDAPHPDDAALGDLRVREVLVRRTSPMAGRRLGDTAIADHPDLALVAAWLDGDLSLPPDPDERVTTNTVLLVAGSRDAIDDVQDRAAGVRPPLRHSNVVIAGMGAGGRAARDALSDEVDATTIDREAGDDVDVVGDVTDVGTFETADLEEASALVVTVDDDSAALFAVAVARTLTDDVDVLVRVNDTEKIPSAFDAGADYALSIQRVSARMLSRAIRGEDVLAPVNQLRLVRVPAGEFAGQTLGEVAPEADSGYVVVGVQRDDAVLTDEATRIADDDRLVVAGTDAAIREFEGQLV